MFGFFKKLFSQEGKEKDPICGMMVNTQTAQYKSTYQGDTYYFCSENCLKQFNAEPKKYLGQQENVPKQSCCQQKGKSCC